MAQKKTLLLCSYGLRPGQITLETLARLKSCDAVYSNCLVPAVADRFKPYCRELVLVKGKRWEPLAKAMFRAFSNRTKIAFLTYGNPFFLNPPAVKLAREAARRGIAFEAAEGVSSFDGIINQLRMGEYAPDGLRLVNLGDGRPDRERGATPSMDTLFFSLWVLNSGRGAEKKRFLAELSPAYARSHPVYLIDHPRSVKTTVGGLAGALDGAGLTTTLYLPAVPDPAPRGARGGRT